MSIRKILPARPVSDASHAAALLELSYLMTAIDGRLADAELEAFREVIGAVRGTSATEADVAEVIGNLAGNVEKDDILARVRVLGAALPEELKDTAFKLAIGLALVDDDADDDENELVGELFGALGIPEARADSLAAEVRNAFANN